MVPAKTAAGPGEAGPKSAHDSPPHADTSGPPAKAKFASKQGQRKTRGYSECETREKIAPAKVTVVAVSETKIDGSTTIDHCQLWMVEEELQEPELPSGRAQS